MSRMRDPERGQILVLVAGGLLVLIAVVALVLEGGTVILNRRDGQNAADLAAVAGARLVALNYTDGGRTSAQVRTEVERVVEDNGCLVDSGTPCDWTARFVGAGLADLGAVGDVASPLPAGSLGVRVEVNRHPGAILGRLPPISRETWDVTTDATAISAKPSSFPAGTMLPIAVCGWGATGQDPCPQASAASGGNYFAFQPGQVYDLTNGKDAPGGFGWLSWDGSNSAGALSDAICTPATRPSRSTARMIPPAPTGASLAPTRAPGRRGSRLIRASPTRVRCGPASTVGSQAEPQSLFPCTT